MTFRRWHVPPDLKQSQVLVLAWTDHYFGEEYLSPQLVENPTGPDIRLDFTTDRSRLDQADAVWFHGPSMTDTPVKSAGQPWVFMSMESAVNYPFMRHPHLDQAFDITMTYRLDSDVPCIYPNWSEYGSFLETPPLRHGPSPGALAVFIASHPVEHRDRYVSKLMESIPIDSPGTCLNNARREGFVAGSGRWERGGWDSILSTLEDYKFYIAFENSMTIDYVSEKVFHALVRGVVPVYLGAPNIRDFMPAPEAVIPAFDFASPRHLAEYLKELDNDDSAYLQHLRWKTDGYSDEFRQLIDLGSIDPRHRLAVKLAHGCNPGCPCGGRLRDPEATI